MTGILVADDGILVRNWCSGLFRDRDSVMKPFGGARVLDTIEKLVDWLRLIRMLPDRWGGQVLRWASQ